ncbi:hypothetical protein QU862_30545, partial [Escherichia coli]|nr:hypothetical protein [Escherichia coli]
MTSLYAGSGCVRKASHPAIDAVLNLRFSFLFRHPYANLQHFIIFFLG